MSDYGFVNECVCGMSNGQHVAGCVYDQPDTGADGRRGQVAALLRKYADAPKQRKYLDLDRDMRDALRYAADVLTDGTLKTHAEWLADALVGTPEKAEKMREMIEHEATEHDKEYVKRSELETDILLEAEWDLRGVERRDECDDSHDKLDGSLVERSELDEALDEFEAEVVMTVWTKRAFQRLAKRLRGGA